MSACCRASLLSLCLLGGLLQVLSQEQGIPELCEIRNGDCKHFCNVNRGDVECSCADGYFLESDGKSCNSNETFKCGALIPADIRSAFTEKQNSKNIKRAAADLNGFNNSSDDLITSSRSASLNNSIIKEEEINQEERIVSQRSTMARIVGGEKCPPGECPWQAVIMNEKNKAICGGTILSEYIILTAAHCMNKSDSIYIKLGESDLLADDGTEAVHMVENTIFQSSFNSITFHNDIALIKVTTPIQFTPFILPACLPEAEFAEKVLMKQPYGIVSGFGRIGEGQKQSDTLLRLAVPYIDRHTCIESTPLQITHRMFCAGYDTEAKDACEGDSGGPHVTYYSGTFYVTGIVSWGEGCARRGRYGIYTQVSKFIHWIREGTKKLMQQDTSRDRLKRHTGPIKRLTL